LQKKKTWLCCLIDSFQLGDVYNLFAGLFFTGFYFLKSFFKMLFCFQYWKQIIHRVYMERFFTLAAFFFFGGKIFCLAGICLFFGLILITRVYEKMLLAYLYPKQWPHDYRDLDMTHIREIWLGIDLSSENKETLLMMFAKWLFYMEGFYILEFWKSLVA